MPQDTIRIDPIRAFSDNYIWILINVNQATACVVDPGDATPVEHYLQANALKLTHILITHHHYDHTGGLNQLTKNHSPVVIGPKTIQGITHPVAHGDTADIDHLTFKVMATPGHTLDHLCYVHDTILFCGDTLFAGGCGRLFEGEAYQLYESLSQLAALPSETAVYCAHEYTTQNLAFCHSVEPNNPALAKRIEYVKAQRADDQPTLPSTIGVERETNVFLRCHLSEAQHDFNQYLNTNGPRQKPLDYFTALRHAKDCF